MKDELLELAGIVNLLEQRCIETRNQVSWLKLNLDKLIEKADNEEIESKKFDEMLNCITRLNTPERFNLDETETGS